MWKQHSAFEMICSDWWVGVSQHIYHNLRHVCVLQLMEAGHRGPSGQTATPGVVGAGRSDHGPVPTLLHSMEAPFAKECQCRRSPALLFAQVRYAAYWGTALGVALTGELFQAEVPGRRLCFAEPAEVKQQMEIFFPLCSPESRVGSRQQSQGPRAWSARSVSAFTHTEANWKPSNRTAAGSVWKTMYVAGGAGKGEATTVSRKEKHRNLSWEFHLELLVTLQKFALRYVNLLLCTEHGIASLDVSSFVYLEPPLPDSRLGVSGVQLTELSRTEGTRLTAWLSRLWQISLPAFTSF